MMGFEGKVVMITGARTGIGLASALQFARQGATVILGVRRPGEANDAIAEIGGFGAEAYEAPMDVSKPEEVERAVRTAVGIAGRLDVLVTSAGIEQPVTAPIGDLSPEDMHKTMDINLKGSWLTIHHAMPFMTKPGAAVTLISSLWSHLGGAGLSAYSATKGGINAMTRSLAVELGKDGVRVNCISPGAILTPMLDRFLGANPEEAFNFKANVPLGRPGRAEEVAEAIVWISSDAASYVTGQILCADGGHTIQMPVGN